LKYFAFISERKDFAGVAGVQALLVEKTKPSTRACFMWNNYTLSVSVVLYFSGIGSKANVF